MRGCPLSARLCSPSGLRAALVSRRGLLPSRGAAPWAWEGEWGKQRALFPPRDLPCAITLLCASLQGGEGPIGLRPSHWVLIDGGPGALTDSRAQIYCLAVVTIQ